MAASVSTSATASKTLTAPTANGSPARISAVAWIPNRDIQFPEWAEAGRRLGAMGRCGQWGLGDWIQYGNAKFGERYARAAHITGYDVQTLMNMVYVASRFEISRRRENLSWSHHETLAALATDEQERWLDLAVSQRFSVSDLRFELRSARRGLKPPSRAASPATAAVEAEPTSAAAPAAVLTCPNCGAAVRVPAGVQGG